MHDKALIGRDWISAKAQLEVRDPGTDEVVARVARCGAEETKQAIDAAEQAFLDWRDRPAQERGELLWRFARLMDARRDDLAELMAREGGKPIQEARGEVDYARSFIEWAAEEGKRIYGEMIPSSKPNKRILVLRQPVGVTAAITPWNFPAAMITRKLGPALAAGCTMVVKPATQTPLTALELGALALEAGIPPGVVNVVPGDSRAIGAELTSNRKVRKLSFTGSTEVGRLLMKQASDNLMRLSMELGGHAPFIVFEDADLDRAVEGAMASKYRHMGQTCICANRFFVHEHVAEAFTEKLRKAVEQLTIGPAMEEETRVGPLIDDDGVAKVQRHVADALDKGAKLITGGEVCRPRSNLKERFFQPTILLGVTGDMLVSQEETFGPVSPIRTFATDDEVVTLANDTEFGLAAYFYTEKASRLMQVAEQLDYGIVGANDGGPSTAQAPFGGVKQSGFGREGGKYAMEEYTVVKYLSWGL